MNVLRKITIELNKTTILFGLVFLVLGYFVGNTIPISGSFLIGSGSLGTTTLENPGTAQAQQHQQAGGSRISLSPEGEPAIGNPDAPVQVYEFSDFQCPFCRRFYSDSVKQMIPEYVETGKVLFVYKDFPLTQIHPAAVPAALYSNCALEQGISIWKAFHDNIFEQQDLLGSGQAGLDQIAEQSGLDMAQLDSCLQNNQDAHLTEIQEDLQLGSSMGVTGTPSIFIGHPDKGFSQIVGAQPYSVVKQTIDQYLQ